VTDSMLYLSEMARK